MTNPEVLLPIVRKYPLATVITNYENQILVSQLPFVVEDLNGQIKFKSHLSTRNPQWQHILKNAQMTLLFNGPNSYISSNWYKIDDVPTWNYIYVQAEGQVQPRTKYSDLIDILKATTNAANDLHDDNWKFNIPADLADENILTSAIGGFEIMPTKFFGRFKLSQSKDIEDQKNIIEHLLKRTDEFSHEIAKAMKTNIWPRK